MEKDAEVLFGVPRGEEISLCEHRAMICLPEDSVEVEIRCKVYSGGKLVDVSKTLDMNDLRTAFKKADDGYIDDEDTFCITEKGLKWLEENETK